MTYGKDNARKPLEELANGMRQVANGRFDTQLEEWPDEPFNGIFADFNHMTANLLEIEAMRESFVSNVAHEFKTPLAYIQGYATLLQDDDLSPQKRKDYSEHINKATRRLADMIGNLLEISNLSRPTATLETETFSLDEQLRHVVAIFIPQIEWKGLSYEVNLPETNISGNKSLLEDAWTNLISNAVKYTPKGGLVSVSIDERNEGVTVSVSDTGCGMTKNQAARAFDRFYQGEASHVTEGTGLGLAIVKAVAKKHGGYVTVESELNKGATFTVVLPK